MDEAGLAATPTSAGSAIEERRASLVHLERWVVGAGGFLLIAATGFASGGYFSDSWAWIALFSLVIATVRLLVLPTVPLQRLDWAFVGSLAAFAAWVGLSGFWAPALTPVMDELLRDLSYASVVLLVLLVVRRATIEPLIVGVLGGVVAVAGYALLQRLLPDRVDGWDPTELFRLAGPIGYWNGLGVFAAMGTLLALGLSARSGSRLVQAFAGAAPVILLATMLFTFSRGAWLALAVGLVVAVAVDASRLQLLAIAIALTLPAGIVLVLATGSAHLTESTVTIQQAADEGHRLLLWILLLAALSGGLVVFVRTIGPRLRLSGRSERAIGIALVAAGVVAAIGVFAVAGAPWTLARDAVDRFQQAPKASGADSTSRLFDLSSNGRLDQWRVSVDQFRDAPIVGEGAGSYEAAWNLDRPAGWAVRDSHNLYIEVLGELGVVGLVLLSLALAVPLAAGLLTRRTPMAVGAISAYAAFLAHAAVDWDWELEAVTLTALLPAAALVVAARSPSTSEPEAARGVRLGLPLLTGALSLVAVVAVLGTTPLARARDAYDSQEFARADDDARMAVRWAPWSSEALDVRGRAQLGLGDVTAARRSFDQATRKSQNDWELWRDLANASSASEAQTALERARRLNPLEQELVELEKQLTSP